MYFYLLAFISFLITILAIPPTIKFAKRFNLIDQNRPVPRAGGLAVFCALFLTIIIFTPLHKTTLGILGGLAILVLVGILDDKYQNLSPYLRLISQFIAASVFVKSGAGINFITNPMGGIIHLDTIKFLPEILGLLWIVWVMNMINWSKGVDGQMPGIVAVSASILGLLSLKLQISHDLSQVNLAMLAFITAGSALGLLIFNWHPAKIFPGFSGSTILGFMIAILAILSGDRKSTALVVLLVPAVDFFYTFFRRVFSGSSPFLGDQKHLHHLLLKIGWSHQKISLFYIITSILLGLVATTLTTQGKVFVGIGVGVIILGAILWLHLFYKYNESED